MAVRWEEPPMQKRGPQGKDGWIEELKARPGEWALLPVLSANNHYYRPRGFEMVERCVDGERRIYGRYVGS